MRLVCSPALSLQDFDAMKEAQEVARLSQASVRADLERLLQTPEAIPATKLLATLVANDILDIRIAFPESKQGLFHDKLGIFEDALGTRVSFRGSANETWRAWGSNHESFDVSCSWRNEQELLRTREHVDSFSDIWRNREPGIITARLDDVTREQILEVADDDLDHAIAMVRTRRPSAPTGVTKRPLMEHQRLVLEDWERKARRGVVNFATGAGKTVTAIAAIKRWTETGAPAVVLVPGRDLHNQWLREIELEMPAVQILPCGGGHRKSDWLELLSLFTAPQGEQDRPRVVISTNATFSSNDFQTRLRSGEHLLIVVDEMHRAGSRTVLPVLEQTRTGATLGLSATFRRQFDDEGTTRLLRIFGSVLSPTIGLAEALMLGLLVPYDYRLHELTLDDDEQMQYDDLTRRIGQLCARGEKATDESSPLRMLLIRRSRLLKQARQKVPAAIAILRNEYRDGDRWLVYCDDRSQMESLLEESLAAGLPVLAFHAEMTSDRDTVLRSLATQGGIVVAIRCLDEGIDIPVTDHALIIASSTAEREYIQRRGRVLRRSDATGKVSAEVHDLLLVDDVGGALTKSEALRALEFVRLARNAAARDRLRAIASLSRDPVDLTDLPLEEEGE